MDLNTLRKNKAARWVVAAAAALMVVVGAWSALAATGNAPAWLPDIFPTADRESSTDTTAIPSADPSAKGASPVSTNTTSVPSGDSATPGDPSPNTDPQPNDTPAPGDSTNPPASGMTLKVLWWNDTDSKSPTGFEVVVGSSAWKPGDVNAESATGTLAGLAYDQKLDLVVYPDGRNGKKLVVPIELTKQMISASEGDAVHVEVSDDRVRVLGTPVVNFDVSMDRF